VYHMARVNRKDQAKKLIAAALANTKLEPHVRQVTAARCYVLLEEPQSAEKHYLDAVKLQQDDAALRLLVARFYATQKQRPKSRPHLAKVLDPKSTATSAQRGVARYLDVLAVAAGGTYADRLRAFAMLEKPETSGITDLYTRLILLLQSPLKRDRLAAIDVLERLQKLRPLTPGARFRLARLYEKHDRWADAKKIVEELLKKNPRSTLLLGWYAVEIISNEGKSPKALARSRKLVNLLKGVQLNGLPTAMAEAQLLTAQGKSADAAKLMNAAVDALVNNRKKLPAADSAQLALAAQTCESLNLLAAAERIETLKAGLAEKPESRLTLAQFLARRGRYADALKVCDEAARKGANPLAVSLVASSVVSAGRPTTADFATAERLIKNALQATRKDKPKTDTILVNYAGLLMAARRLAEAEQIYRQLLPEYPRNIQVLNNLAWLLAHRNHKLDEALLLIGRAVERSGPVHPFLDTRGVIRLQKGNVTQATADFQQAVEELPDPSYSLHLAQAHLAEGNRPAAVAAMKQAFQQGLSLDTLHPLEHPGYHQAVKATGVKE
ncbi:MAG: tetratricopeptide repeat protein, partial [Planctomycetaceae bacterium]